MLEQKCPVTQTATVKKDYENCHSYYCNIGYRDTMGTELELFY